MKTNKQYTDSSRFFAMACIAIVATIIIALVSKSCNAQTGYLITVEAGKQTEVLKTTDTTKADSLINWHICKEIGVKCQLIAVEAAFKHTNFIEIRTENLTIYAEKKQVQKSRYGKLKLKKVRR
jgi:hypothetical protein